MDQVGGKLFSEGAYGCIFYPGFYKSSKTKYVSKVQKDSFSSKNEIFLGNEIKKQPYFLNHFVPVVDSSRIDVTKIDDEDIDNCKIIQNFSHNL